MGKIFDALEKSERKTTKSRFQNTYGKKKNIKDEKLHENIVQISSLNKNIIDLKLDSNLVTFHNQKSVEAEFFKTLRTQLLFLPDRKTPKTILVTSPLPGDGKSFICSNLATSIAQGIEEHVLLIDCDIRKPTIHTIFGYGQTMGLSEYLTQGIDIDKLLLKTAIPKLTILPAGKPPKNPTELLSSKKMKLLLEEVKSRYEDRMIVIDSPPPSMAPETSAIVNFTDAILIVVKAGKTPRSAVAETIDLVGKDKVLGMVLNHADQSVKKYYGYGKSYYDKDGSNTSGV